MKMCSHCLVGASTAREDPEGRARGVTAMPSAVISQPFHLLFLLRPLTGLPLSLFSFKGKWSGGSGPLDECKQKAAL